MMMESSHKFDVEITHKFGVESSHKFDVESTHKFGVERVFWHDTVAMPSTLPTDRDLTALPAQVDVAVIGGGYTGLSAALTLAQQGARVAVLEAETIGWGASSRNGGMTLTGLKVEMTDILKQYGRETARELFQYSLDAIDSVEQIIQSQGIQCGFSRCGHLVVATKAEHYNALPKSVEFMQKEFNHTLRLVPKHELSGEVGSTVYHGGVVDEISGGLNPAQYVTGLARAAEEAGALLCSRAQVTRIERQTGDFILTTARGKLRAEKLFVGTSGYTGGLLPALQKKVIPVGSFIIATEPLSQELVSEISPKSRMIYDTRHYLNYYRFSADRRMIFGGRAAFFPENETTIRQSAEILRAEMVRIFPQLGSAAIDYAWGGTLDFTFDMLPHVGEMEGVCFSLGYAGHGVALATHLGRTAAEAMLKGEINKHPFANLGFPGAPLGLYDGRPWFLPLAGLWYRVLDWIE